MHGDSEYGELTLLLWRTLFATTPNLETLMTKQPNSRVTTIRSR